MKTISISLDSPQSIDKAIKELRQYKEWMQRKCDELRQEVARRIADEAQIGFDSSYVDTALNGINTPASVDVSVDEHDKVSIVIANGSDAVWVEFGAGVYYNTPVGTSPNPYGEEQGFTIGSYGEGNGARQVWGYRNADGTVTLTHGTPATMPMYGAVSKVIQDLPDIAKKVFADG